MIRRFVLFTLALSALSAFCAAQGQDVSVGATIETARADMRADRITIITDTMAFSDKEAQAFWPVYRRYEYERSRVDDRRAAVTKDYFEKHSTLTAEDAKAMAEQMFDCEAALAALKKKYFKEFNAVLPTLTVVKFFQLEHRIDLVMDTKVESVLPPLYISPPSNPQADPAQSYPQSGPALGQQVN